MTVEVSSAADFMAGHARVLDRRRFELLRGPTDNASGVLAALQQDDGGWTVDYMRISPAGSLDWRGYATVRAVEILRQNGRLD